MGATVAILKSIRTLIRMYSNRQVGKSHFLRQLGRQVCELERGAYAEQKDELQEKPKNFSAR